MPHGTEKFLSEGFHHSHGFWKGLRARMHIKFKDPENFSHKRVRNLQNSVSCFTATKAVPMKTVWSPKREVSNLDRGRTEQDACSRHEGS